MFYLRSFARVFGYIWRAIKWPFKWWKWALTNVYAPPWALLVAILCIFIVVIVPVAICVSSCNATWSARAAAERARESERTAQRKAECASKGGSLINDVCFDAKRIPLSGDK